MTNQQKLLASFVLLQCFIIPLMPACSSQSVEIPLDTDTRETDTIPDSLSATLYRPASNGQHPAVVLLHGCAGVLDKHREWASELADWGHVALLVDSFSPRGIDRICEADDKEWRRFDRLRPQDAKAALSYLGTLEGVDSDQIAVMGWSYGGTVTLGLIEDNADEEPLGFSAAVAVYPSCWQHQQGMHQPEYFPTAPLLITIGAEDDWTRPEHCEQLISQLDRNASSVSLEQYAGAYHDFDNRRQPLIKLTGVRIEEDQGYGTVTIGYHRTAHKAALSDVREFLSKP